MLLCFDYDGVVVDSLAFLLAVVRCAQRDLGMGRVPSRSDFETIEHLTFVAFGEHIGIPPRGLERFASLVFEHQQIRRPLPIPFPGMPAVLSDLAARHTVAVVSSSHSNFIRASLDAHALAGFVDEVLGADHPGTKSERVRASMAANRVCPGHTVLIGDAVSDIREARAAGVGAVAVTWGFQSAARLARERPDRQVDDPHALGRLLEGWVEDRSSP